MKYIIVYVISLAILASLLLLPPTVKSYAEAPITPSTSSYLPSTATLEVKTSISATDAKSRWIKRLHLCENPDNIPWIWDSNGKKSFGAFMFQESTWLSYGKPFGATMENINDDVLQAKVARSMLDKGLSGHWYTCAKKVVRLYGAYPQP